MLEIPNEIISIYKHIFHSTFYIVAYQNHTYVQAIVETTKVLYSHRLDFQKFFNEVVNDESSEYKFKT